MEQFIYQLRPTRMEMLSEGPTEREAAVVAEHFAYLQDLLGQQVVLLAGRTRTTDEQTFGIVVFEADSDGSARQIMENDPAVNEGIMSARLFPFGVALWSETGPQLRPL